MTPPCVVPTFRPYTVENLEFGGFYASSCESRVKMPMRHSFLSPAFSADIKGAVRVLNMLERRLSCKFGSEKQGNRD